MMAIWPALQFLKVFSQPWEGDVTMVLPSSFMQIKKSITNPSTQDLKDACVQVRPTELLSDLEDCSNPCSSHELLPELVWLCVWDCFLFFQWCEL